MKTSHHFVKSFQYNKNFCRRKGGMDLLLSKRNYLSMAFSTGTGMLRSVR